MTSSNGKWVGYFVILKFKCNLKCDTYNIKVLIPLKNKLALSFKKVMKYCIIEVQNQANILGFLV